MAEFVVKLNNKQKERNFLTKLNINFKTLNAKNMILTRSLVYFEDNKDLYAVVNVTPVIPNVPAFASILAFLLYTGIYLIFDNAIKSLLVGGIIMTFMSIGWSKQFFYFLLKKSMLKYGVTNMERI